MLNLRSIDPSIELPIPKNTLETSQTEQLSANDTNIGSDEAQFGKKCATVEEMGEIFGRGYLAESLRARRIIRNHFDLHGMILLLAH